MAHKPRLVYRMMRTNSEAGKNGRMARVAWCAALRRRHFAGVELEYDEPGFGCAHPRANGARSGRLTQLKPGRHSSAEGRPAGEIAMCGMNGVDHRRPEAFRGSLGSLCPQRLRLSDAVRCARLLRPSCFYIHTHHTRIDKSPSSVQVKPSFRRPDDIIRTHGLSRVFSNKLDGGLDVCFGETRLSQFRRGQHRPI